MPARVLVTRDHANMGVCAARIIAHFIVNPPDPPGHPNFGSATGGTVEPVYEELVRMHRDEGLDFSRVRGFGLDEYVGVRPTHASSYHHFMGSKLWNHVNVQPGSWHLPNPGMKGPAGLVAEGARYERVIRTSGGIGLQLLGLGPECHIAFCVPGTSPESRTHVADLDEATRTANKRYFDDDLERVPRQAMTVGLATIMGARRILVVVNGEHKARWVARAIEEDATVLQAPAVILRVHSDVTWVLDEAAASLLTRTSLERWVP